MLQDVIIFENQRKKVNQRWKESAA